MPVEFGRKRAVLVYRKRLLQRWVERIARGSQNVLKDRHPNTRFRAVSRRSPKRQERRRILQNDDKVRRGIDSGRSSFGAVQVRRMCGWNLRFLIESHERSIHSVVHATTQKWQISARTTRRALEGMDDRPNAPALQLKPGLLLLGTRHCGLCRGVVGIVNAGR